MNWATHCGRLSLSLFTLKTAGVIHLSSDCWKACYFYHFELIQIRVGRRGWGLFPEDPDTIFCAHHLSV